LLNNMLKISFVRFPGLFIYIVHEHATLCKLISVGVLVVRTVIVWSPVYNL